MMRLSRLFLFFVLCISLAAGVTAQDAPPPLKIGFVADQTGVGYLFAQSQLAGLQVAVNEINAAGGILGRRVEFIIRDAQLRADVGTTIARQMILEDGVELLLGPTSSSVALALAAVAQEYQIPLALHTSNSIALSTTGWNPYVVQVVPHTTIETRAAAQFMSELGYTDWGTIGPDYSFGRDGYASFTQRLLELTPNARIISEQWPPLAERDLTSYITALQAAAPEAVFGNLWGDQFVTFTNQAKQLGLFETTEYIGLMDLDYMRAIGEDIPENVYGYTRAPFYALEGERVDRFLAAYRRLAGGQYPADWAVMMYDAVYALKAAVERAGTTEGEAVAAAFNGLEFESLRGTLTIRECDHMANVGAWVGRAGFVDEYPFPILIDPVFVPFDEVALTCEEVLATRAG